uniref:Peptidase S1 domain-containing protein n=1 Tax=Bionectria ochroleuca TaxID=29856 RepID=A0A8H7TNR3_BIOOC
MAPKLALAALMALPALTMGAAVPDVESRGIEIVGGSKATSGQFPYIVSLTTDSTLCGAVLINANTVVTAAHCTVDESGNTLAASSLTVRAGSLKWASGGKTSKISKVTHHPSYSGSTTDYDVAVLKLSTSIATSSTIAYATLTSSGEDPSGTITVAGWGLTSENSQSIPADLSYVKVPVIDRATCAKDYSEVNAITDNMFCAGLTQGGKDSCSGDSGGPVIGSDGKLVGVVSWGVGCARAGYPGVYTRLGNFISWINSNI